MDFYYVYKSLAHPEKEGLVQPMILDERLAHIEKAKKQLGTEIPWLADSMTNDLKHALGDRNNSEFVISPEGKIVIARSWSDPEALRKDLAELVGESETVTTIADLNLKTKTESRPEKIATGVIQKVERPANAQPLQVSVVAEEAENEGKPEPLYVKLRAEAVTSTLKVGGRGKLYLGFHLDPIHRVHWNNLAAPLKFEIEGPEGVLFSKTSGTAAKPEEAKADLDPREFLIDLEMPADSLPEEPFLVKVKYFACDDDDQWCKAVSQTFAVEFKTDRDGGRVQNRRSPRNGSGKRMRPGMSGMPTFDEMITRMDANEDGKIAKAEARGPFEARFAQMDGDNDGFLAGEELTPFKERMNRMREMRTRRQQPVD